MSASAVETPTKGENKNFKFKSFFRSRSRSRTRELMPSDLPSHPSQHPLPPLPRNTPADPSSSDNPPSSYLKSSLRSQPRPISSTTTATHSTITPLPSDALRYRISRGRHTCVYQPQSTDTYASIQDHDQSSVSCECDSNDHNFPRSETPSSSSRKLVLPSFFGISLTRRSSLSASTSRHSASTSERKGSPSTAASEPKTKSSRKRSFRFASRPSTPKSVDESSSTTSPYSIPVPSSPLPLSASPRRRSFGLGSSQRSTPKSSSGHLPLPHALTTPRSHGRRHSVTSERPPHDSAVALPEEPSHRNVHNSPHILPDGGGRNKGKERERLFSDSEMLLPDFRPSVIFISKSLPADPSPVSRNHLPSQLAGHSVSPHLSTVDSTTEDENDKPSLLASHRIPPVPRIIHTPPTPQRPGETVSPSTPSTSLPAVDPGCKSDTAKGKTVTIAHREQVLVLSSNSHTNVPQPPTSSKGRFTPRFFGGKDARKTKDSNTQKSNRRPPVTSTPVSNIAAPVRSMTNHRSQLGSFDFERPVSALNREGSHISKDNSSHAKSSLHSLERTISNDETRGGNSRFIPHPSGQSSILSQSGLGHVADASVMSFSSVSLQTKSTGKGTGSTTPAGQSSSWGRASGRHVVRTSHGTFAFEHPSSVPNSPNPQTFNLPSGLNQNGLSGLSSGPAQSQPATLPNNVVDTRAKHSRGQSYNTSDYADPGHAKPGGRTTKSKGRSLDLGLGLSWAPSRLREEVLMPGLMLKAKQEKNSTDGLDVTKVFESLLSESRFQTFKKYVHRFDAHIIPLEGPIGLLARVEKLLTDSGLNEREKRSLMSEFTIFVENHSG